MFRVSRSPLFSGYLVLCTVFWCCIMVLEEPCCVHVHKQDNKNISDRLTAFHQNTPTQLFFFFFFSPFPFPERSLLLAASGLNYGCTPRAALISHRCSARTLTERSRHRRTRRNNHRAPGTGRLDNRYPFYPQIIRSKLVQTERAESQTGDKRSTTGADKPEEDSRRVRGSGE